MDFIHLIGRRNDEIDGSVDCYLNANEIVSFWFEDNIAIVRTKRFENSKTIYDAFYSDSVDYLKSLIR